MGCHWLNGARPIEEADEGDGTGVKVNQLYDLWLMNGDEQHKLQRLLNKIHTVYEQMVFKLVLVAGEIILADKIRDTLLLIKGSPYFFAFGSCQQLQVLQYIEYVCVFYWSIMSSLVFREVSMRCPMRLTNVLW